MRRLILTLLCALGLTMQHVPFRGGAPGMQAVISGDTQLSYENTPTPIGSIRDGLLRPAVVSGRTRDAALPDVPSLEEAGMPPSPGSATWHRAARPAL